MYYCIKDNKIIGKSTTFMIVPYCITIEKEFTDEEKNLIDKKYSYNIETGEFEKGQEAIEYEAKLIQEEKTSILKKLGELKQIKDGMELVLEDTTEIDNQINELKEKFISL